MQALFKRSSAACSSAVHTTNKQAVVHLTAPICSTQGRFVDQAAPARLPQLAVLHAASTATSSSSNPTTAADAAETASFTGPVDYFATDKRPVILYDGVCNLCNGGVNFMLQADRAGVYRLAALQSTPGRQLLMRCGRAPDDISSIVLVEEGGHYIKSDAVLRIASRLGLPLPLLAAVFGLMPQPLRDTAYDQVANNRYSFFGRTESCRCDAGSLSAFKDRFLGA